MNTSSPVILGAGVAVFIGFIFLMIGPPRHVPLPPNPSRPLRLRPPWWPRAGSA